MSGVTAAGPGQGASVPAGRGQALCSGSLAETGEQSGDQTTGRVSDPRESGLKGPLWRRAAR